MTNRALRTSPHRLLRSLSGSVLVLTLLVSGATAQGARFGGGPYFNEPDLLISPRAVVYRLQDRGFSEIGRPRFDGTAYIIDATNPAGLRTRLFVDARDGAVLGRQRLEAPFYPSGRPGRSAPGYGWTEEDVRPERVARAPDGFVPPADIPAGVRPPRFEVGPEASTARGGASAANPLGVNPDARPRPAPRRSAKLTQPEKPNPPAVTPAAPAPSAEGATPPAVRPEPPRSEPVTPATNQNAADKPVADKPAARKEQAWQDPPSDEAKRPVRVIGGATVVPGSGEPAATGN